MTLQAADNRRVAALLVLLLVASALTFVAFAPHLAARRLEHEIARNLADIGRVLAEARSTTVLLHAKADSLSSKNYSDYLLPGDTAGLAAAELQRLVLAQMSRHQSYASTIQVQPPKIDGDFMRISVLMDMRVSSENLQRLLFDLETSVPLLVVEGLSLRTLAAEQNGPADTRLRVTMRVMGYQRKPGTP